MAPTPGWMPKLRQSRRGASRLHSMAKSVTRPPRNKILKLAGCRPPTIVVSWRCPFARALRHACCHVGSSGRFSSSLVTHSHLRSVPRSTNRPRLFTRRRWLFRLENGTPVDALFWRRPPCWGCWASCVCKCVECSLNVVAVFGVEDWFHLWGCDILNFTTQFVEKVEFSAVAADWDQGEASDEVEWVLFSCCCFFKRLPYFFWFDENFVWACC